MTKDDKKQSDNDYRNKERRRLVTLRFETRLRRSKLVSQREDLEFDLRETNAEIKLIESKAGDKGNPSDDPNYALLWVEMAGIQTKIKQIDLEIGEIDQELKRLNIRIEALKTDKDEIASLGNVQNPSNAFNAKMPWPGADSQSGPGKPAKPPARPIDPLDRSPFDLPAVERKVNDLWRSRNDPAPKNQPDPLDTSRPRRCRRNRQALSCRRRRRKSPPLSCFTTIPLRTPGGAT